MATEQGIAGPEPSEPPLGVPPPLPNEVSTQDGGVRPKTNLVSWLVCLYFRPRKFFAEHARSTSTSVVAICAYIFGAAWYLTYFMSPQRRAEIPTDAAAGYVFGYTLLGAVVGGLFWYFLAGSWYGLRVLLCSPEGMSWKLSRRAFIFSELVYALPGAIGIAIWWVIRDGSFLIATAIVIALLIFWSVYVSYRGVRTLFKVARVRAVLFFVVLPSLLYAACFAMPLVPTDVKSPLARVEEPFENAFFRMRRPANWEAMESPGPGSVSFHIPDVGSFVATVADLEGGTIDSAEMSQAMVQDMAAKFKTVAKELDTFPTWGSYSGHGRRISMNVVGQDDHRTHLLRFTAGRPPVGYERDQHGRGRSPAPASV